MKSYIYSVIFYNDYINCSLCYMYYEYFIRLANNNDLLKM